MQRTAAWVLLATVLAGCPSTTANVRGDSGVGDVALTSDAGDAGGAREAGGEDVQIEFQFNSASLEGRDGDVSVQAQITWHGTVNGSDGSVSFEGEFR